MEVGKSYFRSTNLIEGYR